MRETDKRAVSDGATLWLSHSCTESITHHFVMGEISEDFPKTNRILKRGLFKRVYEGGRKFQARYFTAFVLPNSGPQPRIGITVTRKVGNSVERNRARRRVREVFRKNKWLVPAGVDIVINVKKPLLEALYSDLEGDFCDFLEKACNK